MNDLGPRPHFVEATLKRGVGQILIVGFLGLMLALAAGSQHRADQLYRQTQALERRIDSSCDMLGVPPGDACRAEIRRLREADLRREGAALADTSADPVETPNPNRPEANRNVPNDPERDRIRRCLRDINRVLNGEIARAASCRRA